MDRILTKNIYIVFQFLKILLIKICKIQSLEFYFLLLLLAFTLAHIIFHKFSEFYSTLFEKKIFVTNFPFLIDSVNSLSDPHPHPLSSQNPLSVTRFFCQWSITYHSFSRLLCYDDALEELEQQSRINNSIRLKSQGRCLHIRPWIEVSQQRLFMAGKLL